MTNFKSGDKVVVHRPSSREMHGKKGVVHSVIPDKVMGSVVKVDFKDGFGPRPVGADILRQHAPKKKFKEFVAEAKSKLDPVDHGHAYSKTFSKHQAKVGDRVTLHGSKKTRGTVTDITKEKTVVGHKKFMHIDHDDGTKSKHRVDTTHHDIWRFR